MRTFTSIFCIFIRFWFNFPVYMSLENVLLFPFRSIFQIEIFCLSVNLRVLNCICTALNFFSFKFDFADGEMLQLEQYLDRLSDTFFIFINFVFQFVRFALGKKIGCWSRWRRWRCVTLEVRQRRWWRRPEMARTPMIRTTASLLSRRPMFQTIYMLDAIDALPWVGDRWLLHGVVSSSGDECCQNVMLEKCYTSCSKTAWMRWKCIEFDWKAIRRDALFHLHPSHAATHTITRRRMDFKPIITVISVIFMSPMVFCFRLSCAYSAERISPSAP